ncbi:HD-GYP domain-containing protein [Maridesulfovibrio sp. FT414]|uniref:HD-GYP domain-containing protein n=1 Tax=Maridesulfovibrio sp. FT414 TaxID=2979469 RepID=UPI003D806617
MMEQESKEYRIEVERLRVGVFIRVEGVPWYRHPFLTSSFRIKSDDQIETLKALGLKKVVCIPDKSLVAPLKSAKKEAVRPAFSLPGENPVPDAFYEEKRQRIEILKAKKESVARAERQYTISADQIENIMLSINRGNAQYLDEAIQLSNELSGYFVRDREAIMHVLNMQGNKKDNIYYHSLNVTVLALILGRSLGFTDDEMAHLALGAIFHDIGKSRIEKKVLYKRDKLTKPEMLLLRKHPYFGVALLSGNQEFPVESMDVVYQHHERFDGKGFPRGLCGGSISKLAMVLSVANFYDKLINKRDIAKSLTPYQALSYMFSRCSQMFDKEHLSVFIHCMGIYPPGTIVVLNNEILGMVISVNLAKPLQPSLVLYDPQVPQNEALIIDLEKETDLYITDSLSPAKLEKEVYEYLSPRARITYFVDPTFSSGTQSDQH